MIVRLSVVRSQKNTSSLVRDIVLSLITKEKGDRHVIDKTVGQSKDMAIFTIT